MAREFTVNGLVFDFPDAGDEPGWGNSVTDWAEEVTNVLNDLAGIDDILQTTFTIANNQSSAANVEGLLFNTGRVRSAQIPYTIYRISDANPSGHAETGVIRIVYDNDAGAGEKWQMSVGDIAGNSGVSLSILDSGQVQYTSTDIDDVGYEGTMLFSADALNLEA